ncbi:hypothetical protein M501DRAFT_1001150 [Patellaria atrata CBS 101060]|uniref:Uncharacterized protein n=1 Tax=Patellaria atrata CBS 101060 TaxID=1346257 RepID=A0A9P4S3R2_9PEZI|nr:hypothetical protein M501DRAFT_1001150 [Patellaria atrata CBS 101060]
MSTPTSQRYITEDFLTSKPTMESPTKFQGRRILGELTPNARIVSPKPYKASDGKITSTRCLSPLKQVHSISSFSPTRPGSPQRGLEESASFPGRKRSFAEMGGRGSREETPRASPFKQTFNAAIMDETISPAPVDFHAEIKDQDDVPDDVSSTEEDELEPEDEEQQQHDSQQTNISFASLIDYDAANSSQHTQDASITPASSISKSGILKSQAETLRLRLRVAMYKVKTQQTTTPIDELKISPALLEIYQPSPTLRSEPSQEESNSLGDDQSSSPSKSKSTSTSSYPKLLPAPILLPTAYSSRFITGTYLPSSPPIPVTPATRRSTDGETLETPTVNNGLKLSADVEKDLTSSVVKGQAANGLLELMHAA